MSKLISKIVVPDSNEATGYSLYNVKDSGAIHSSDVGVAGGVASLDNAGKVPSSQLPSYVDDVVEGYYHENKFYTTYTPGQEEEDPGTYSGEITAETGKIYVDIPTNQSYRWSGSAYIVISSPYVLPTASANTLGGVKVGDGLSIDNNGVLSAEGGGGSVEVVQTTGNSTTAVMSQKAVTDELADKQDVLISGTTIKTVNGNSLLGSGNIEIDGGTSGEVITINLTTNQDSTYDSDLIGATITVTDNTESTTLLSTTWAGEAIEFEVPVPVSYTVAVGSVSNYKTPTSVTYSSRTGRTRNLTFQYQTEVITVTVNTNVTGVTAEGQVITINGVNTTIPASGEVSQKIAFGTSYSVSVNGKSGYNKPSNLSYTANSISRTATMTYTKIVDGVFAVTTTGDLVQYADINTSSPSSYVGVAIKDTSKNMSFFIDKRFPTGSAAAANVGNFKAWSAALYNKDQSYLTNISTGTGDGQSISTAAPSETRTAAFNAYNNGETGIANTTNLVNDSNASSENASNNAAKYCRSIANPVTGSYDGYLASLAEWIVVNDNQVAVNQILNAIGGVAFASTNSGYNASGNTYTYYWTSSECSSRYAWRWYWYSSYSFAYFLYGNKNSASQYGCARPFFPLA